MSLLFTVHNAISYLNAVALWYDMLCILYISELSFPPPPKFLLFLPFIALFAFISSLINYDRKRYTFKAAA
jgi:hypothetical protein